MLLSGDMHSYLISSVNDELIQNEIDKLAKKLHARAMEFPVTKIDDTRDLNNFTALAVDSLQLIVLKNIEEATPEALNALLKNLEEPGENIYYCLTCNNLAQVLPTIKSRCQIINAIRHTPYAIRQDGEPEKFMNLTISEKFKALEKIKDRGEAVDFVKQLIIFLHPQIISNAKNIEICQQVFTNLKANGNLTIQLTYLAVNII